jgi:phytanoyl-CoA hydroxylase
MTIPMLTPQQLSDWERDGFILIRNFVGEAVGRAMSQELIAAIRGPGRPEGKSAIPWETPEGLFIQPEAQAESGEVAGQMPEDIVAKAFNPHLFGKAGEFAISQKCGAIVEELLDTKASVFQSMFILKNPGAWGQPWHQDAFYFDFDTSPQIGLWLAISEATLENGCLSVLPGSHKHPIHEHGPDKREGSNYGYREVDVSDNDKAVPVLMQPGDLLVFHSHLLHKSVDNQGVARREAMVLHYAPTGSVNQADAHMKPIHDKIYRWIPVKSEPELAPA